MSFSAQTCLTNTGTTTLGSTIVFYSDVDGYFTSFGSTSTTNIVGGNCPFTITGIPNGTTSIRLYDPTSNCCVNIPIQSNDFCVTCDLDFTVLSSTTVSQIVAGNLTGSCDNITDYVVYWYGPNSSTNIGYISGKGSAFSYQFTHPLTGTSAIFAQAGTYTPIIDKVKISGLTFSQTGGSGNYLANLECFSPITVNALTCSNGNQPLSAYTHFYQFTSAAVGVTPSPLSVTFQLSANTNFFPYEFRADTITDTLKITLNSVNYSEPIVLEWLTLGTGAPGNLTTFPRGNTTTSYLQRVLTLTGFTISNGDYLTVEITPNLFNPQTNWYFGCTCKESFDCVTCFDNYQSNPYPILSSSLSVSPQSCNRVNINFDVTGCTQNEIYSEDLYNYVLSEQTLGQIGRSVTNNTTKRLNLSYPNLYYTNISCSLDTSIVPFPVCEIPNSNSITYEKNILVGIGNINIIFSDFSDLSDFYTSYNTNYSSFSGSPSNPLSIDYYRSFSLSIPTPLTSNCGDGTTFQQYDIHYSSVVTTGGTGPWFMNLTMPTISSSLSFDSCDLNCQSFVDTIVNVVNNASTGTSNNISGTTTTGSRAVDPFGRRYRVSSGSTSVTTFSRRSTINFNEYQVKTIGWSGISNTYITNLSGQTCDFSTWFLIGGNYNKSTFNYEVRLINPLNVQDFEIWGSPITNYVFSGFPSSAIYELALQYSGGSITYSNPYYVI